MITKHIGVFCVGAKCGKFFYFSSHPAKSENEIGSDFSFEDGGHTLKCDHCGFVCTYQNVDIAHSAFEDGRNARFPYRD